MSVLSVQKAVTVQSLLSKKQQGQKLASLTCYDYTTARILEAANCLDFLLVGDSLAMTVLGHPNTLSVTVDEMLHHVKAVSRGISQLLVVADMPFMSYQIDQASAVRNAGRFIQEGQAGAVKLEGASPLVLETIKHLTQIGIPVMGHLGLTPQSIHTLGGFKVQGKTLQAARQLWHDAHALQAAGAFAVVFEMIPVEVATWLSEALTIPTIGIGSGNGCDGQILVIDDVLGRYDQLSPKFVRTYMDSKGLIQAAVQGYAQDIRDSRFPDNQQEAFGFPSSLRAEFKQLKSGKAKTAEITEDLEAIQPDPAYSPPQLMVL